MTFKHVELETWETGFCAQRNFEAGSAVMAEVNRQKRPYFAPEIRGSARLTSGTRRDIRERKRKVGYHFDKSQFCSCLKH